MKTATHEDVCQRCKAATGNLLYRGLDHFSNDPFSVLCCDDCGVAWTAPGTYDTDPDRFYPPAYYGEDGERFLGSLERLIELFRRSRVREVTRFAPQPGRVLDIGCGRGWMLRELHHLGWTAVGVERTLNAIAPREQPGVEFLEAPSLKDCAFESSSFQAITLWHSLEHLEEPWETLDEANRLLTPDGIVIIEVPNRASLQARLTGRDWFHLDAPRHRIHLTLQQLVEDLEKRGLQILARRTLSLEYGPYGMLQSLLNLTTHRNNILYQMLRRQGPVTPKLGELLATALLTPVAVAAGFPLELAAAVLGHGGVAHVVARKPPAGKPV